jgi:hypothetical protein
MENMTYLRKCRNFGHATAEIWARLPVQLRPRGRAAGWVECPRRSNSDSLFRSRPNYTIPSGRYRLLARKLSLVLTALLFAASGAAQAASVSALSPSFADVSKAIAAAHDGDTVIVPAGTASWTAILNISKGITIQGKTTTSNENSANPTFNDATIIKDDSPGSIMKVTLTPSQAFRVTGLTFAPGARISGGPAGIMITSTGATPNMQVRIDHCHFDQIRQSENIYIKGWTYGVVDHNVIKCLNGTDSFMTEAGSYGGKIVGNGAWADYPWFGTNKFMFYEDNYIQGTGISILSGNCDSAFGARFVLRHNWWQNAIAETHGTEGAYQRGHRAWEAYDNTFNWTIQNSGMFGQRSGVVLWHDNIINGTAPTDNSVGHFVDYRQGTMRPNPIWGISDGTSPWDQNDTEGNGTFVEGHAPHVFDSGTATTTAVVNPNTGTFTDTKKSWTPNQWVNYSIQNANPASPSYPRGDKILSNTANTITFNHSVSSDGKYYLTFAAGDAYQIHRVLTTMDQNGRGKGDLITGPYNATPINSTTGNASWTHQALEPNFSWNNVGPGGLALVFKTSSVTLKPNRDYYDVGIGLAKDSTPAMVSQTYNAALNGTAYTGTYTYPHPLASDLAPPSNLTIVP